MTYEEALKQALSSTPLNAGKNNREYVEAIIKALEKQIPKKPVIKFVAGLNREYGGFCPNCGSEDCGCTENWHNDFCCECGQAIDWGEND